MITRIKDTREDNDKTQKEIAQLLNTTQQQYWRYELGKRELPLSHLKTLAKYYNISADYIIGLIDEPKLLYERKKQNEWQFKYWRTISITMERN